MTDSQFEIEIDIRSTADEVWDALTNPDKTRQYWHHALNRSTWTPGAPWTSESSDGEIYLDGEIIEVDRPTHLVHTFHFDAQPGLEEAPSVVAWDITPRADGCRLRLSHSGLGPLALASVTSAQGWEHILSGLKALVESGTPLAVGAPGDT